MKARRIIALVAVVPFACVQGAETVVTPAIESVAMFKNGLAVVRASFGAGEAGDFVWVDPPAAVHGAFFVESGPGLVIRSTTRLMTPEGPSEPSGSLQWDLAGATVRATLLGGQREVADEVTGRVWTPPVRERGDWDTNYATTDANSSRYWYSRLPAGHEAGRVHAGNWLVLEVDGQRHLLAADRIGQIRVQEEAAERLEVPRPVMVFSAPAAGKVQLTYLTKGMAWMPSYQVDLLAGDRVRLRQSAVVRNELMDLQGTKLELISGYPNIKFAHLDSPLNSGATLAAFFQQLSSGGGGRSGIASQQIAYNITSNMIESQPAAPEPEAGAPAEDLHYESIGAHDLLEGDALSLEVASAETSGERVVEWRVPDYRDGRGHVQRDRDREGEDEPWDAVRFANPLAFPMTTAAASVLEEGRFRGQSMATWTAPGHQASIRINKALTVRGEHSEIEEEGGREVVWVGGNDYQRTVVKGSLKVSNARSEAVTMVIRADFSGELLTAEGDPAKTLRADGARSVNPHRQLEWKIELGGSEERTIEYRYALLVDR